MTKYDTIGKSVERVNKIMKIQKKKLFLGTGLAIIILSFITAFMIIQSNNKNQFKESLSRTSISSIKKSLTLQLNGDFSKTIAALELIIGSVETVLDTEKLSKDSSSELSISAVKQHGGNSKNNEKMIMKNLKIRLTF